MNQKKNYHIGIRHSPIAWNSTNNNKSTYSRGVIRSTNVPRKTRASGTEADEKGWSI